METNIQIYSSLLGQKCVMRYTHVQGTVLGVVYDCEFLFLIAFSDGSLYEAKSHEIQIELKGL